MMPSLSTWSRRKLSSARQKRKVGSFRDSQELRCKPWLCKRWASFQTSSSFWTRSQVDHWQESRIISLVLIRHSMDQSSMTSPTSHFKSMTSTWREWKKHSILSMSLVFKELRRPSISSFLSTTHATRLKVMLPMSSAVCLNLDLRMTHLEDHQEFFLLDLQLPESNHKLRFCASSTASSTSAAELCWQMLFKETQKLAKLLSSAWLKVIWFPIIF